MDDVPREPDTFDPLGRALSLLVESADVVEPHRLIELVTRCAAILGAQSADVWLADHQKRILVHLAVADTREQLTIDGSTAGRAYITSEVVEVEDDDGSRIWIPLVTGVDRLGVLELAIPEHAPSVAPLRDFAAVVAAEVVAADQYTDLFTRTRRQKRMTLAAELQWASLPPGSFATKGVHVAGMMQPAYEVGGDTFDYAHSAGLLSFAIFDAVGHSLGSSMISSLTLGAYRNSRRSGLSLTETAAALDDVIQGQFRDSSYVTGQLAELDTTSGTLRWLNAGHPLPLLVRHGKVLDHLQCRPRPPFGLDDRRGREPELATEQLQPGDAVLLYSDGVIEHRSGSGTDYGIERLRDFLQNAFAAQMSPDETLRRLSNAILDFHGGTLQDDATTILVVWEHDE